MVCRLRKVLTDDLEMVMRWRMLPEVTQYMYSDPQLTLVDQTRWLERINSTGKDSAWIIELDQPRTPVGLLSLSEMDTVHQRCAWAYYIADPAARGKGLAKPLECNVYDYVFERLGFNRLWCEVFSSNDRVVALHERFGSKVEGMLRQHIFKNGQFHDVVRMAVLKDEWLNKRKEIKYSTIEIE
jgi:UDP-4-amino-4,6-dideoxy-N-acetyl-beta-L-altrosamine N-acetyltransferase